MKTNQPMGKVADVSGEQWTLENQVGMLKEVLSDIQVMSDAIHGTLFGPPDQRPQMGSAAEPSSMQWEIERLTEGAKDIRETLNATLTSLTNKR